MIWQVLIPLVPAIGAVLLGLAAWLKSLATERQLQAHSNTPHGSNTSASPGVYPGS